MTTESRTILITGATGGLGRELARQYASEPGHLILHGRNAEKLREVAGELTGSTAKISTVQADLSELAQVRRLAEDVAKLTDGLSVLVNNAGIGQGSGDVREESADGVELRLAVNHLAPFALTLHLLPLLRAGAPARVVNVASAAQTAVDFADPQMKSGYSGSRAYAQSKFAMIATGFHLAGLLPAEEITVNSLHPATLMPTAMVAEGWGVTVDDLATGVAAVRNLIDSPDLAGVSGRYFYKQEPAEALSQAHDPGVQQRLWRLSEEWSGVRLPEQGDHMGDTLAGALEREHEEIDAGIESFVDSLERGSPRPEELTRAIAALRRHIYLEEEFLFPPLRESGMLPPVLVMLREHGEIWRTMDALEAEPDTELCRELLGRLGRHNDKEEAIIYPEGDARLSADATRRLHDFIESGTMPAGWVCRMA